MKNNPWENMKITSIKRISSKIPFNIFWAKDSLSRYCYLIKLKEDIPLKKINLKEIEIIYNKDYANEFLIVLKDSKNWEIFLILCKDLIETSLLVKTEKELIEKTYERLNEWKNLLKSNYKNKLSFEEQMGLFTELNTLNNIISKKVNLTMAINSWRGAERELQDFLCEKSAIEVKSTISSKGNTVTISSLHQLESVKEKFFLIFYSLSQGMNGETITNLVEKIDKKIDTEEAKMLFYKKLLNVGYDLLEEDYEKFIIDKVEFYQITEEFPKITSKDLDSRIKEVKYKINLTECASFKVTEETVEENI